MGQKSRIRRRKFNVRLGRHSFLCRKRYHKAKLIANEHLKALKCIKVRKPYRIVKHMSVVNGQPCLKLHVKRITQFSSQCKTLRSVSIPNNSGLKLSFHCEENSFEGYRLFDVGLLLTFMTEITKHVALCKDANQNCINDSGKSPIEFISEKNKCGFASEFLSVCSCGKKFSLPTSSQIGLKDGTSHHDVNVRAVWGTLVTGRGVSALNESFSTLNVPSMSQPKFSSIENSIGNLWNTCLDEDMMAAAQEERKLAIERGDFHEGVPAISVICDGGWSKRSHKHTYNALGGVGVILGAATGKLLHIGVRNRLCYICTMAETRHEEPPRHTCFKNWSQSSQAMEADIIVDGFKRAESLHGVRYMRVIADGDSSVYAKIQECVPVWGKHVSKMECANHCCKCLRSSLEKLVLEKPEYKGKGGLTKSIRVRLVTAVRCAIRMRSKEKDRKKAIRKLDHDIRNSIHHIFGDHSRCSDFCKSNEKKTTINIDVNEEPEQDEDGIEIVFKDQEQFWSEGSLENSLEESRLAYTSDLSLNSDLLLDISILLDRIARKSSRLIGNHTTNLAESWMAIRSKFDGGKVHNRCNRGSWNGRCYGAALRKNFGPAWSPIIWQKVTNTKPGTNFISVYRQRSIQLVKCMKSKMNPEVRARKRKRQQKSTAVNNSKKAKREYGDVLDTVEDVSKEELESKCSSYLKQHVNLTDNQCQKIKELTKYQSLNVTWKAERRKRLTASNFGDIIRRNPNISVKKLVQRLLYSQFTGNKYTSQGIQAEGDAILEYKQRKSDDNEEVEVTRTGLAIDLKNKHLGASTDGIVKTKLGSVGLLEIKYLLQKNKLTFQEACKKIKGFCLENINGSLQLKKNHNYFYQCQGQLNILDVQWLDFVVRRTNPYQIFIQRIDRDINLWENVMLPKLTAFYMKALLPELVVPRNHTTTGIREPSLPWFVSKVAADKPTKKKIQRRTSNTSKDNRDSATSSLSNDNTHTVATRRSRRLCTRFVGRRILHEWCIDEASGKTQWYPGRVLDVLRGRDGQQNTLYEVLYDGEKVAHEIENLHEDLASGSLKFIDI